MNRTASLLGQIRQRPIFVFAAVGLVSTTIDLIVLKSLLLLGVPTWLATALGFSAGLINGYLMNSRFVFRVGRTVAQSVKYTAVSLGGLLITEGIVLGLSDYLELTTQFRAKLIAVVIVFFWNYGLSRVWAFK